MSDDLVHEHYGLAVTMAKRMRRYVHLRGPLDFDDLVQVGLMALLGAARRYNPALGVSFSTYACECIRFKMVEAIRQYRDLIRIPRHVSGEKRAELAKLLRAGRLHRRTRFAEQRCEPADERGQDGIDAVDRADHLDSCLSRLKPRQKVVVEGTLAGKSTVEIAEELGCTRANTWAALQEGIAMMSGRKAKKNARTLPLDAAGS